MIESYKITHGVGNEVFFFCHNTRARDKSCETDWRDI